MVYNQRFHIPEDDRLYITVGVAGVRPFASNSTFAARRPRAGSAGAGSDRHAGFEERQSINVQETISINLFSANTDARLRNHEVIMALGSVRAQQACEEHSMHIAPLPSTFNDVSEVEGTARLNRFSITINVLRAYEKKTARDYYDKFPQPQPDINQ